MLNIYIYISIYISVYQYTHTFTFNHLEEFIGFFTPVFSKMSSGNLLLPCQLFGLVFFSPLGKSIKQFFTKFLPPKGHLYFFKHYCLQIYCSLSLNTAFCFHQQFHDFHIEIPWIMFLFCSKFYLGPQMRG